MKRNTRFVLSLSLSFLPGCAAYQIPPLTIEHPAHLDAQPAPAILRSGTLAYGPMDVHEVARPVSGAADGREPEATREMHAQARETVIGEGQVVATVPSANQLIVEHGEIRGFMDAMTMGYRVDPPSLLDGLKPGEQVRFTIDVSRKTIVKIERK